MTMQFLFYRDLSFGHAGGPGGCWGSFHVYFFARLSELLQGVIVRGVSGRCGGLDS